jgi:hypothetical protein
MYALLGDGDEALHYLRLYFHHFDRASTMYTEASPDSPVMETPPSAARCVQDMLLQSHDAIHVFPAVPSNWPDAAFHSLLAEGAFEVSASRRDGRTQFVRIKSLAGEPCRLRTDLSDPVRRTDDGDVPIATSEKGIVTLSLAKGEEALLTERNYNGEFTITPVHHDPRDCNYYGLKGCQ